MGGGHIFEGRVSYSTLDPEQNKAVIEANRTTVLRCAGTGIPCSTVRGKRCFLPRPCLFFLEVVLNWEMGRCVAGGGWFDR